MRKSKKNDDIVKGLLGKPYTMETKGLLKYGGRIDSNGIIVCVVLSDGTRIEAKENEAP